MSFQVLQQKNMFYAEVEWPPRYILHGMPLTIMQLEQECNESNKKGNSKKLRERLCPGNKKMILTVAYLTERKGLELPYQSVCKTKERK